MCLSDMLKNTGLFTCFAKRTLRNNLEAEATEIREAPKSIDRYL